MSAEGLEPGTVLTLTTEHVGSQSYIIGEDGTPEGAIGFFSAGRGSPLLVGVQATASGGAALSGELEIDD